MDAEQTLKAYENDPNAKQTIQKAISSAYQDLRPELELTHGYETAGMPTFYDSFNRGYGMGTGADQMDPMSRLNSAAQNVALKSATARTARGILDTRRVGMNDLIADSYDQWRTGYGMASDTYNREMQRKQYEESIRQFNENLALQKYAASRSGGGGSTIVYNLGDDKSGETTKTTTNPAQDFSTKVAQYKQLRQSGKLTASIDWLHSQLLKEAQTKGLGVDSETLWVMLGNTPKSVTNAIDPASKYFNLTSSGYGGLKL
jgi:hypothetical protein